MLWEDDLDVLQPAKIRGAVVKKIRVFRIFVFIYQKCLYLSVVKVHDFLFCMNKIIPISCFALLFIGLFFVLGTQTACQKQNTNCTCVITVDSTAYPTPVSGAFVQLSAPHGTVGSNGTTGSSGIVTFNFALPAIFNVQVTRILKAGDTLKGSGIIQLQVGQTESTTIVVHH
jgi:hypothetical protein